MAEDSPRGPFERFFRACLLVLAGVVCIVIALNLVGLVWGWLLLLAGLALAVWVAITLYRYWWGRR